MMELMQRLVEHGVKVTFVNTDFTHHLVTNASPKDEKMNDLVSLVSLPDGVESAEDRNDLGKLSAAIFQVMPAKLEELVKNINGNDGDKVTCIVADQCMGWAFGVAEKMKIRTAAFWPAAATVLASLFSIPKLLEDGIINNKGTPMKKQMVQLSPTMPAINSTDFTWVCIGDLKTQNDLFDLMVKANEFAKLADSIICNSAYQLETATFTLFPDILPIGPLLASNRLAKQNGYFWKEDSTCLAWLDQQPPKSVIYVAFGSSTFLDCRQFHELALGLELTKRPFLWVVRPGMNGDMDHDYLIGYMNRISNRGSTAGFEPSFSGLLHEPLWLELCIRGHEQWHTSHMLALLCRSIINQKYISDIWKTGLELSKDESGVISREEIKNKIEQLLKDDVCKVSTIDLKEKLRVAVGKEGDSDKNFNKLIDWIQDKDSWSKDHCDNPRS